MTPSQVNDPNILEDYTLKYVWGPKTQQLHPFGAPVKIQTPSKAPVATSTTRAGLTQLVAARQRRACSPELGEAHARRHPTRPGVCARVAVLAEASWFWPDRWSPHRRIGQPMRVSDIIPTPLPFLPFKFPPG